jgi:adenylate cyclase
MPRLPANEKDDLSPAAEEVQQQLQKILASPEFPATDLQREFLQFVVTEAVAGRDQEIKAYTVATRVFGRSGDFNQALDPIVSIQANKLRRALERYYLVAGRRDPVRIDIPRGTYVPTFHARTNVELNRISGILEADEILYDGSWPAVLVRPFQNLTGDQEKDYLGIGLATELTIELSRYQEIRVLMGGPEGDTRGALGGVARFVINGLIRQDKAGIKVTVQLIDTKTDKQIWGDTRRSDLEASAQMAFEEEFARTVAFKTVGDHGFISRSLSMESRSKPPSELKAYEAILRYYEYDRTLTPDSFLRALEALEYARSVEPECGQVWTMLGRLYGDIYGLDLPGFETALEKAIAFAEKGVQLNPDNQRARGVLALIRMFSNEIPAALAETERALALNPNSLFILDGIGYLLTLLGDWERGPALIKKVIQLNPYHGPYVPYALWLDWVRQQEYEQAHLETLNIWGLTVFWEPLVKAATFGLLGRTEEGRRCCENLLQLKPDFPTRGRLLIGHYIKFGEIVERVIAGLQKAGLDIQ